MRTYTEKELLKAISYACEYQKGCDYQAAGQLLMVEKEDLQNSLILLLDGLSDENTAFSKIELKDVFN